jgi:hypothetical protein
MKPLAQSACAPTFDEQDRRLEHFRAPCNGAECCAGGGVQGGHKVWRTPIGPQTLGSTVCVYDQARTQLVAARSCSDAPLTECSNNESCVESGIPYADLGLDDLSTLPHRCQFDTAKNQADSCEAPLEETRGACAPTFTEQPSRPIACGASTRIIVATCGEAKVWTRSTPLSFRESQCTYGADGRLVTAEICGSSSCDKTCVHAGALSSSILECTFAETPAPACT